MNTTIEANPTMKRMNPPIPSRNQAIKTPAEAAEIQIPLKQNKLLTLIEYVHKNYRSDED